MYSASDLSCEEMEILTRLQRYFHCHEMPVRDKVFHAILIAHYELEAQHYSNDAQKMRIIHFKNTLESLLGKMDSQS